MSPDSGFVAPPPPWYGPPPPTPYPTLLAQNCGHTQLSWILRTSLCRNVHSYIFQCTLLWRDAHFHFVGWTLSQDSVGRSRETVVKRKFWAPGIARRTVVDVSMLSTWNHECCSYIVFCISMVAPRTVLDVSMLTTCYYSYYVVLHSYCVVLVLLVLHLHVHIHIHIHSDLPWHLQIHTRKVHAYMYTYGGAWESWVIYVYIFIYAYYTWINK